MPRNWTVPERRAVRDARRACVAAVLACLFALACGGNDNPNKNQIKPIVATATIPAVGGDPVVFFQEVLDADTSDDLVMVDVMVRMATPQEFDGYTLEIMFDFGVIQVGQVDASGAPFGNCNAGVVCQQLSDAGSANASGDLLIGVGLTPGGGGTSFTPSAGVDTRLLTLGIIAASTGTSSLTFVSGAGRGDCEILLDRSEVSPPILCDDGNTPGMIDGARITGTR